MRAKNGWARPVIGKDVTHDVSESDEPPHGGSDVSDTKPHFDFRNSLGYLINLLSRILVSDYLRRIEGTGIAPAQAYVLGELWDEQPLPQVELARRLEIGKATIGQTINRLEQQKLIRRFRSSEDKRLMMIALTERGRDLQGPLESAAIEQLDMLRRRYGETELEELRKKLGAFADEMRAYAGAGEQDRNRK